MDPKLESFTPALYEVELSVVLPCLNEARTLGYCIEQIQTTFKKHNIAGEIIIADNGSTDRSIEIANKLGVQVVNVSSKGYGNAIQGGIEKARGRFIIMGDSDRSYDFTHIPRLLEALNHGSDLVIGNRFSGGIQKGAMPFLHKYLGNPILSFIGRLLFNIPCRDFHCGLRGFSKEKYKLWKLSSPGMEFASEMLVKASFHRSQIREVPTVLLPDGRNRPPHLRTWRDGWRHLRFLFVYSPKWTFLIPSGTLLMSGVLSGLFALGDFLPQTLAWHRKLPYLTGTLFLASYISFLFYICSGVYNDTHRISQIKHLPSWFYHGFTIELGLLTGLCLITTGLVGSLGAFFFPSFLTTAFSSAVTSTDVFIGSAALILTGWQTVMASFFLTMVNSKWLE